MLLKCRLSTRAAGEGLFWASRGVCVLVFSAPWGASKYLRFKAVPLDGYNETTVVRTLAERLSQFFGAHCPFVLDDRWTESGGVRGRICTHFNGLLSFKTPRRPDDWDYTDADADLSRLRRGQSFHVLADLHWADFLQDARRSVGDNIEVTLHGSELRLKAHDIYSRGGLRANLKKALRHEGLGVPGPVAFDTSKAVFRELLRHDSHALAQDETGFIYGSNSVIGGLLGRARSGCGVAFEHKAVIMAERGFIPFFC